MKRIALTIAFAAAFLCAAAQHTDTADNAASDGLRSLRYTSAISSFSPTIDNGYPCIVRNFNLTYSLVVTKTNATTIMFSMVDHNSFTTTFSPPSTAPYFFSTKISCDFSGSGYSDIVVNDVYIANNYAFFCGSIDGTTAYYGFFEINGFFSNPPNVTITMHSVVSAPDDPPATLKKLVAYPSGTSFKVVAIGDKAGDPSYVNSMVVEVFDATLTFPTCIVAQMPVNNSPLYAGKVFLDDIVLTDNNVVVMGRDWNVLSPSGVSYPLFAIGNRAHVVADICDILSNNNYYLNASWDANDAVAGVALLNNKFAMAYVYFNDKAKRYYTRLRVIDPSNMANTYSQEFSKSDKENPVEMVYLKAVGKVELLQPIADSSNFILLDPHATGTTYPAPMFKPDGREYKSLSRIGPLSSGTSFISARSGTLYLEDVTVTVPHSSSSCPSNTNKRVTVIDNLTILNATPATEVFNGLSSCPSPNLTIPIWGIINNCYSYE